MKDLHDTKTALVTLTLITNKPNKQINDSMNFMGGAIFKSCDQYECKIKVDTGTKFPVHLPKMFNY